MRFRMKRPELPSDHLTANLDEDVDLRICDDGSFEGDDAEVLNEDKVFLREVIASLARQLKEKEE